MKCSPIRPALWAIDRHASTGHSTDFIILGKDTKYVVGSPPPTSTTRICGGINPCDCSMWCLSDEATTNTLHYEKLTLVRFLSQNVAPSPVTLRLYTSSPICPHMNPGVQTITFVFSNLVSIPTLKNMSTLTDSVS